MSEIKFVPFSKVIKDITSQYIKIKKQDYKESGQYPIVDQSKQFICGYTNKTLDSQNMNKQVIVFGDHTRNFKYIDFPIAISSDGVKVLEVNQKLFYTHFVYYYLKFIKLEDAGYSRHFKFLKEKKIPFLEIEEQIKISNYLHQIENLIKQREESINLLDELIKSTFFDMFGSPINNSKSLKTLMINEFTDVLTGATPNRNIDKYYENGMINWIKTTEVQNNYILSAHEKISLAAINETSCKEFPINTIIIAMYGEGKTRGQIGVLKIKAASNQACSAILPNVKYSYLFMFYQLQYMYKLLRSLGRGGARPNLNLSMIKRLKVISPLYEDNKDIKFFEKIVEKIENLKKSNQNNLDYLIELFESVSQRAFKGELNLNKIEIKPKLEVKEIIKKTKQEIVKQPKKETKSILNNLLNIGLILGGTTLTAYTAKKIFENYNKDIEYDIIKSGKDIIDFTNNIIEYDKDVKLYFNDRFLKSFIKVFQEKEVVLNNRLLEELFKIEFEKKPTFSDIKDALVNLLEKKEVEQFKHKYETTNGFEENVAFRVKK